MLDQTGKDARALMGFYKEETFGLSRTRALEAFDVLRSIMEGYWNVLSPHLLEALRSVYKNLPDRKGGLFCDVPMIHLWAECALYQLGSPYHLNVGKHWRATYKAKAHRMYVDSFVFDQCRSFYDFLPLIELWGDDLQSLEKQMIFRICVDAICKARGDLVPQLYSGGNLICLYEEPWATKAAVPQREELI